ncbi:MAG: metallophosphoesterase [Acidobacteria bacterium]|nr:metallophosphoesterase [Acidobacteriota bacterium]
MLRIALIVALVAAIFLAFNVLSVRQLLRIHPRRKRLILAVAIGCNLMWLCLPILNARTDLSRFLRATLGPPWFAWTVFAILYSFVIAATLFIWLLFARRHPFAEFARWPSRVFITIVIAGGLVGMYQALVPLRVERVPIVINTLPPHLDGFRIALLGDLHVGLFTRSSRLTKIFATTESLNADAVVIAGDLVDDDPYFVPKLLAGTQSLSPSRPLVAVLGNHEMYGDPYGVIAALRNSRIRLLVNEGADMRGVWFAGVSDYAGTRALAPDLNAALARRPPNAFPIVIAHQPKGFADARERHLPLTLCAHTHGGQFGFRPLRWSLAGVFLPFHMGLYERGDSQLYVNTGTGYWLLPFRLGMTPEITLIELHRAPR